MVELVQLLVDAGASHESAARAVEIFDALIGGAGIKDALMLSRVTHLRELARDLDRDLELLQRYFTPPA